MTTDRRIVRAFPSLVIASLVFAGCASPESEREPASASSAPESEAKPLAAEQTAEEQTAEDVKDAKKKKARPPRSRQDDERVAALLSKLQSDAKTGSSGSSFEREVGAAPGKVEGVSAKDLGERLEEDWMEIEVSLGSDDFGAMNEEQLLAAQGTLRRFDRDLRRYLWQLHQLKKAKLTELEAAQQEDMRELEEWIREDKRAKRAVLELIDLQEYADLRGELNVGYEAQRKELKATFRPYLSEVQDRRRAVGGWDRQVSVALREIEEGSRTR